MQVENDETVKAASGAWMSYSEAAGRLNISREAVRRRADRGHWAKRGNNEDR
jgi:hypothetical protein